MQITHIPLYIHIVLNLLPSEMSVMFNNSNPEWAVIWLQTNWIRPQKCKRSWTHLQRLSGSCESSDGSHAADLRDEPDSGCYRGLWEL